MIWRVRFQFLLLTVATLAPSMNGVAVDMGTCSCVCGGKDGNVLSQIPQSGNFYQRLRGPKGEIGRSGKSGPKGSIGLPGIKGEQGQPGICEPYTMPKNQTWKLERAKSCYHLLNNGITESGFYVIKPSESSQEINVFCDMESAGGGWTLVASVHENNIHGKCTNGDLWSSDQGLMNNTYLGNQNWENLNTFGEPEAATSSDYKSPAYYSLPASDVMVWHVPNDVEISRASDEASLKYHTDSGFLDKYQGSLRNMFKNHFPLRKAAHRGKRANPMEDLSKILTVFNRASSSIRSLVPSYYSYTYDFSGDKHNHISDGGSDMFDGGNKVYYGSESFSVGPVLYNRNYVNLTEGVYFRCETTQPFNAHMWIDNSDGKNERFHLKVASGTGADGGGSHRTSSGQLSAGNLKLSYHAHHVYGASDPSVCHVFYYIVNPVAWGSVEPATFERSPWTDATDGLNNGIVITGTPKFLLMGYILLSRSAAVDVENSQITNVLNKVLELISGIRSAAIACDRMDESLVEPITFLTGDSTAVMAGIPPNERSKTEAGFLQFRPYSIEGLPSAFCPGVKTSTCNTQSICVGGINTMPYDQLTCGDYAGWGGKPTDSPTATQPSGSARSLNDLKSTLLIFTRKLE